MEYGKGKISPMMDQYFQIKKDYADVILFFRLGDFMKCFLMMPRSPARSWIWCSPGPGLRRAERAPMCGVPFHSADSYIAKLVSRGYKVAICEQMEDPALAKGIVKREVIRIITCAGSSAPLDRSRPGRAGGLAEALSHADQPGLCRSVAG